MGDTQDEELADLQRRFSALEDETRVASERANASATLSTPRNVAMRTPRERTIAAELRAENEADLAKLDEQITALRRKHDELVHANMEKRSDLDRLQDKLADLTKEAQLPSESENPIMREISALEARLKKAVSKYEDAFEVRQTYEQIVKRLKEERIGFENKLEARELALRAKEADYEELLLMSHDANQSKEMAKNELAKFEAAVSEERKLREKELSERRALVSKKEEVNMELERKEKARREAMATAQSGGPGSADKARSNAKHVISEADIEEEQEKIASYEAAFREIKEATGVADVNEVIQKFITQEETHKNLLAMTKESQGKIEKLTAAKQAAMERVQLLKYSATSDEQQASAAEQSERKFEKQRLKHERLAKVLVSVKAGVQHLSERLEGISIDEPTMTLSDDNMVDVVHQCERKLRVVMEAIREEEEALVRDLGEAALQKRSVMPSEPPVVNNNRVREGADGEEALSEEEFEEDLEEEVVDRELLKKQSGTILDKATKKTKKRGKKKEA